MIPITDDRLKQILVELKEAILYGDPTVFNIDEFREQQEIIDEIISLRSQKARLISELERYRDGEESILQSYPSIYGEGAKFAYNAVLKLLKELEE